MNHKFFSLLDTSAIVKLWFYPMLLFFTISSCQPTPVENNNSIHINVKLDSLDIQGYIYLFQMTPENLFLLDSAIVNEDKMTNFSFQPTQANDIYVIRFSPNQAITLVLDSCSQIELIIKKQPINANYKVIGSADSELMRQINAIINTHSNNFEEYYSAYRSAPKESDIKILRKQTDSLLRLNQINLYNELTKIISKNPSSLASLVGLYSKFGNERILNVELDFNLFKLVSDSLEQSKPYNLHAIALRNSIDIFIENKELIVKKEELLDIGHIFPDVSLLSLDNNVIRIRDNKANYKIIYLWKSNYSKFWEINPKLNSIYKQYKSQGLEVFAISFEEDKLAWANYCKMEKFNWINLIADPRQASIINPNDVYPRIFLLDKDCKIIGKDIDVEQVEQLILDKQ